MGKQFFQDFYGNTASITENGSSFLLICRDYCGKIWKLKEYDTARGAKIALSKTGDGWNATKDKSAVREGDWNMSCGHKFVSVKNLIDGIDLGDYASQLPQFRKDSDTVINIMERIIPTDIKFHDQVDIVDDIVDHLEALFLKCAYEYLTIDCELDEIPEDLVTEIQGKAGEFDYEESLNDIPAIIDRWFDVEFDK